MESKKRVRCVGVVRGIDVKRGYKNIASALRVSPDKVRELISLGAPVLFDGEVPYAEAAELWEWRKATLDESTQ